MKTLSLLAALCLTVALAGCATSSDTQVTSPGAVSECTTDCTEPCGKKCGDDCSKPCCAEDASPGAVSDEAPCPYSGTEKSASTCSTSKAATCESTKATCESTKATCTSEK
jgi:hypothetical protein